MEGFEYCEGPCELIYGEGDEPSRWVGSGGNEQTVPRDTGKYDYWTTFGSGAGYLNSPPYGITMWEATGGIAGQEEDWEWGAFTQLGTINGGDTVRFKKNNDSTMWVDVDWNLFELPKAWLFN